MISNGHQIEEVRKKQKEIELILNRNTPVFETPHAIYPDIRLEYIANGPENSDNKPDVYFTLPFTAPSWENSQIAQRYEICFSIQNTSANQWILGSINTPAQYQYNSFKYTSANGQGVFITDMTPYANYLNASSISKTMTFVNYFCNDTAHTNGGILHDAGFFDRQEQYTQTVNNNWVYQAGKIVNTALSSGMHTVNCGDGLGDVLDNFGAGDVNIYATSSLGMSQKYLFRGNSSYGKCYSGLKIFYVKHFRPVRYNYSGYPLLFEIDACYVPVLHWDNDSSTYRPCFYDKISGAYSSYNLGSDTPVYLNTNDKILDYIGNGAFLGMQRDVLFNTNRDVCDNTLTGKTRYRCIFSTSKPDKGTANRSILFGSNRSSPTILANTRDYSANTKHSIDIGDNSFTRNDSEYRFSVIDSSIKGSTGGSNSYTSDSKNYPIMIFGYYSDNSYVPVYGGNRMYYFDISSSYNNSGYGTWARSTLIPVLHNGTPCLYDYNRNTYIYNSGNYSPTYGLQGVNVQVGGS